MRLTQDSLRTLADGTGGFAAVDVNGFQDAFGRIIDANSRYYLLGYTPPTHPRNGRFHRIEVIVKRPGLKAVARRGYPSPSGKTREERTQEALDRWARDRRSGGANETSPELLAALNSPVQQPGLTLAVHAVPFKVTAKEASVAMAVELQGTELEFAQQPNGLFADTIEMSFFALNEDGRPQRGTRAALNLADPARDLPADKVAWRPLECAHDARNRTLPVAGGRARSPDRPERYRLLRYLRP